MSILSFGHRVRKSGELARPIPRELAAHPPQRLVRSVPFRFEPAQSAGSVDMFKKPELLSLHKELIESFEAAREALRLADLLGLRAEVIVGVDDSGSIMDQWQLVLRMLVRLLGYALHLDANGQIQVIVYGRYTEDPIIVDRSNYLQIATLIKPTFGGTPMTQVLQKAVRMADGNDTLTIFCNITDGDPNSKITMSQATIESSGHPVINKHFSVKPVPYLNEIDDLPSCYEIRKDANGQPILDDNDMLIIDRNPAGLRFIDNVDSQAIDPVHATNDEFATAFATEINACIEVMGRVGLLTGVPGVDRIF